MPYEGWLITIFDCWYARPGTRIRLWRISVHEVDHLKLAALLNMVASTQLPIEGLGECWIEVRVESLPSAGSRRIWMMRTQRGRVPLKSISLASSPTSHASE